MRIFADLNVNTYGDFIALATCVSSIKESLSNAKLTVHFRNNRPYKIPLAECINADYFSSFSEHELLPIHALGSSSHRVKLKNRFWEENELYKADLVISGDMIKVNMLNSNPFIHLNPPDRTKNKALEFLEKKGLDLSKWYACVYWKEVYAYRGITHSRIIHNPQPYIDAINFIIDELNGQVVRIGHFGQSKIAPRKNLIDLTLHENITEIEIHAVNQARFFVGTCSGPMSLAFSFGVPTLACDATNLSGLWDTRHYALTQSYKINDDKKEISQKEAYDLGLLKSFDLYGTQEVLYNHTVRVIFNKNKYILRKNNSDEIINGVKEIFEFTKENKHLEKKVLIDKKIKKISFPLDDGPDSVISLKPFSKRK